MPRNILVPLDGSAFSERALPGACRLALSSDATVHVVRIHVPPTQAPVSLEGMPVTDPDLDAARWEAERAYVTRIRRRLGPRSRLATKIAVLNGPVAETLVTYASFNRIDLIVMSTHGRRGLARAWVGSVADALMRSSRVPVLLVRPAEHETPGPVPKTRPRILITLDGSPLAEEVVERAVELGRSLDADYALLRIVNPVGLGEAFALSMGKGVAAHHEAEAASYLTQIGWWLRERGLEVETKVIVSERPAQEILTEAERQGAAFIAMATHGRSGLARLLMGSVAGAVLNGTKVPLLLYRPRVERRTLREEPAVLTAVT